MNNCYIKENISFSKGLFDNIADAVYILTMENSKRKNSYMNQIYEFKLHKNIFIMKNKGFKNCIKNVCSNNNKNCVIINNTESDAVNAYINVFKDAIIMKYNKIIVLEDDFTCSPELKNMYHIKNIEKITKNMSKKLFAFGVLPLVTTYKNKYLRRCWLGTGAHATLIPKYYFEKLAKKEHKICEMDFYLNFNIGTKYIYYKPLITQTFPQTANFKNWGNNCAGKILGEIFRFIIKIIINSLGLDEKEEPGTSRMYFINRIIYDYFIPIILIFYIYKFCIQKKLI